MLRLLICFSVLLISREGLTQIQDYSTTPLPLNDLSAFASPPKNWKIAGDIRNGYPDTSLKTTRGTGVLYDDYSKNIQFAEGSNLFTNFEHGDCFVSLDFLIPKGSNSGIFFQGRYEIQLFDSWLVQPPRSVDCGGIYERWDDSRPEGNKGYEGHPPRVNASLAPNVWQHLDVEFQAPRFDAAGKKTSPARFVKVVLNGITIHENVVVFGPTRAAAFTDEKPLGPLMIQGDHGPVAFRNMRYALLNDFKANLTDLTYTYYEGKFNDFNALTKANETRGGAADGIDFKLADDPNALGLVFKGTLNVDAAAEYLFTVLRNGMTTLSIDGESILTQNNDFARKQLTAGAHTLDLRYIKNYSWRPTKLGLLISKQNARPVALHLPASIPNESPAPLIRVDVTGEPEIVRSFMDFKGKKKTHVISVGYSGGINFAYDLDQAGLLKIWRGDYLDVTEMWYERGEPQLAAPMGATIELTGHPIVSLSSSAKTEVVPDTLDYLQDFIYKGYRLSAERNPIFKYAYKNITVEDGLKPAQNNEGITRTVSLSHVNPSQYIYIRLAEGTSIEKVGDNLYAINNQQYFVQLPATGKAKVEILQFSGKQILVMRCMADVTFEYNLIW